MSVAIGRDPPSTPTPVGPRVDVFEQLEEMEEEHPRHPQIALSAATFRFETDDHEGSLIPAVRTAELAHHDADAYCAVAKSALRLGNVDHFEVYPLRTLALDRGHRDALQLTASSTSRLGKYHAPSILDPDCINLTLRRRPIPTAQSPVGSVQSPESHIRVDTDAIRVDL
jgi:hypothetical protein